VATPVPNRAVKADAAMTEPTDRTMDFFTEPDLRISK
jgi:hypothetical protein